MLDRIESLLAEGSTLIANGCDGSNGYWIKPDLISQTYSWISSVANSIQFITPQNNFYIDELKRLMANENLKNGIPFEIVQKLHGLLNSLKEEASRGMVRKLEYIVIATTLDDFLDHAESFHKANKPREAGVLAAIVLEDTVKKIASKNDLSPSGKTLDPIIDELVKIGVFTPVKAKRVKAYAGVRNGALHAEWDKFDNKDAGELISGVRELIEHFL
ncbi:MAG: hypothetical protein HZA04_04940 [Nitrospinae bacterium]|nr:hypothetical protein [Nitrospinota bacterium]